MLQPTSVMVVVITSTGGVTKQVVPARRAGRSRADRLGGRVPRGADRRVSASDRERFGAGSRRRSSRRASAAFLALIGQTLLEVGATAGPQVFVGGTAGLVVGGARAEEFEATMRLVELLERRAAVLELLSEALEPQRPVVHVGPEVGGAELRSVSPRRRDRTGSARHALGAVGLVGPVRMDYEKAIRTVRAAAFELSRFVEDVYEDA